MDLTFLLPKPDPADAIEERYASWQSQLMLRAQEPAAMARFFGAAESARSAVAGVATDLVLVLTDPLLVPSPESVARLRAALGESDAVAAVPGMNESSNAHQQQAASAPYLTLRQFEAAAAAAVLRRSITVWDSSDPGMFLCRRAALEASETPLARALEGQRVVIAGEVYCHRYSSLRGQLRTDLLERISSDARSVLEFGCGEGALAVALKERQGCRVVGIEMDETAAAIASQKLDAVHRGDVRQLVDTIEERFDWIVGGDILEHLDEPWSFLAHLRKLALPGGRLLLSVPNIAAWPIVADLLRGRFDYVYMGITCAGHLRFFTRKSIGEMLAISGWETVAIEPQPAFVTPEFEELRAKLDRAGIEYSLEDLLAPGYYVQARNPHVDPADV